MNDDNHEVQDAVKRYYGRQGTDWLPFTMLILGLAVGLFLGYVLNVEKEASVRADVSCGVCQDNLNTMIGNFNTLAKQCKEVNIMFNVSDYIKYNYTGGLNAS